MRSKSEMLLANEFTRRGMYFEYEEPADKVLDALPDFTFPDYGNIVLEHLGLLTDPNYFERWETKAKEYERKGIRYLRTSEEEIKALSGTVDRLQNQLKAWTEEKLGAERLKLVELVERLRRESGLRIGRAIGEFQNGIFEINDRKDDDAVAIALGRGSSPPSGTNIPGYPEILWEPQRIKDIDVWFGRKKK